MAVQVDAIETRELLLNPAAAAVAVEQSTLFGEAIEMSIFL